MIGAATAAKETREHFCTGDVDSQLLAVIQRVEFCLRNVAVLRQPPDQLRALGRTDSAQAHLAFSFTLMSSKYLTK